MPFGPALPLLGFYLKEQMDKPVSLSANFKSSKKRQEKTKNKKKRNKFSKVK